MAVGDRTKTFLDQFLEECKLMTDPGRVVGDSVNCKIVRNNIVFT